MVSLQEHKGQRSQTHVFSKAEMEARPWASKYPLDCSEIVSYKRRYKKRTF